MLVGLVAVRMAFDESSVNVQLVPLPITEDEKTMTAPRRGTRSMFCFPKEFRRIPRPFGVAIDTVAAACESHK